MGYFDSAFVAKFYLDEPESDAVRALAERLGRVCCNVLGRLEVASVFHRKLREGALGKQPIENSALNLTTIARRTYGRGYRSARL